MDWVWSASVPTLHEPNLHEFTPHLINTRCSFHSKLKAPNSKLRTQNSKLNTDSDAFEIIKRLQTHITLIMRLATSAAKLADLGGFLSAAFRTSNGFGFCEEERFI
jgi:hypothetical protein